MAYTHNLSERADELADCWKLNESSMQVQPAAQKVVRQATYSPTRRSHPPHMTPVTCNWDLGHRCVYGPLGTMDGHAWKPPREVFTLG